MIETYEQTTETPGMPQPAGPVASAEARDEKSNSMNVRVASSVDNWVYGVPVISWVNVCPYLFTGASYMSPSWV